MSLTAGPLGPLRWNTYQELEFRNLIPFSVQPNTQGGFLSWRGHNPYDPDVIQQSNTSANGWNMMTYNNGNIRDLGYRKYRVYGARCDVRVDLAGITTGTAGTITNNTSATASIGLSSYNTLNAHGANLWLFADYDSLSQTTTPVRYDCIEQANRGVFVTSRPDSTGMQSLKASLKMTTGQIWAGQQNHTFNWCNTSSPGSYITPWHFNLGIFRRIPDDISSYMNFLVEVKITYFVEFMAPALKIIGCFSVFSNPAEQDDQPALTTQPHGINTALADYPPFQDLDTDPGVTYDWDTFDDDWPIA